MAKNINENEWEEISEAEALGVSQPDEWEMVSEEEALGSQIEPRGRIAELGAALKSGFIDLAHMTGRAYQKFEPTGRLVEQYFQSLGTPSPTTKAMEKMELAQTKLAPTRKGLEGWALNVIGRGAPYLAATVASGGAIGLSGPFAIGFGMGFDQMYTAAKESGQSENRAMVEGAFGGLAEAALEMWGVSNLLKVKGSTGLAMRSLVKNVKNKLWKQSLGNLAAIGKNQLKSAVIEGLEEMSQGTASIIIPGVSRGDWPSKGDAVKQVLQEGAGGALLGGLIPGGMEAGKVGIEATAPSQARIEGAAKAIQKSKMGDYAKARSLQALEEMLPVAEQGRAKGLFEISETTKRRLQIAKKFETVLVDLEGKRRQIKAETKEEVGKKLQAMKETFENSDIADDPFIAGQIARSYAKGLARKQIPELSEQISRDEITELYQAIREGNLPRGDLASMMTFFEAIKSGVQPYKSHIKIFDKFFGTNILKQAKRQQKGAGKLISIAAEPFNLLKAIVCSADFSAGGIQALMVLPNHPLIWTKGVGKGYRAFFSPEYVDLTEMEMKTNPHFETIQQYAPDLITEVGSRTTGEEYFVSELAHRIPAVGALVRASDRAFVTTLNNIRSSLFYQYMEQHPTASNAEIKEILDHIGNITGRGRGKPGSRFEKYAPELGAVLWAPRLYLGTFKTMTDWISKPHVRKIAAGNLLQATGFLLAILGLASLDPDNEVEIDPRSTDFGKIKRGNTRIAFFGRHTQMIRVAAQILKAEKKATSTGRIHSRKRLKIAARFIRSKLNPMAGIGVDIFTGKTFHGERTRWTDPQFTSKYIYQHIAPMFLQDLVDAAKYQGIGTAFWTSPLGLHGVGVQTYEIHKTGESMRLKNHYAHQFFGADWDELGPETQKTLRKTQPLIELYEDRAKIEQEKYAYENWADEEQREAGRKVRKGLTESIQKELDRLELPFGGFSRRLSSRWFLNEERYKKYQDQSQKLINRVAPMIIESAGWKGLAPKVQREMLDQLIKECKKAVRQDITNQAKFEDLERVVL